MLNDTRQLELLLVDVADVSNTSIASQKLELVQQVVRHILQLSVCWVVEVAGDGYAIVRL